MADITVTAANVQHAAGATRQTYIAAAAITAGQAVYLDSNNQAALAQHDGTAAEAAAIGIAISSAPGAGQPVEVQLRGDVDLGATLTIGEVYVVGAAAGGIAPVADPTGGDFMTVLGVATAANNLKMGIIVGPATA